MAKKARELTAELVGLVNNPQQHIPRILTDELDYESLAKLKYEVLQDQTVDCGMKKAAEYIDLPIFKGEREVGDQHVQFLYDELRKGTFNPLLVILSTALFQGVTYKINGQHTAWAVVYMCEHKPDFAIKVREIKYKVNSEEQLKLLYATYDRLKARSDAHVSKVFLIGSVAAEGIWNNVLSKLVSGFRFWHVELDSERRRISPEQLSAVIQREYGELFRAVGQYVQQNHTQELSQRMAVVAGMFATFEKVPTKAAEFWQPVLDGLGLTAKSDPRYALREALLKTATKISGRTGESREKRLMTSEELYRICILSWNKWRKGETVQASPRPSKTRIKPV
jgi:hypothetical protein